MFCPNCGTQLKEGSKFCTSCGTRVAELNAPQQSAPVQPTEPVEPQQNSANAYPAWGGNAVPQQPAEPQQPAQPAEPIQPQQPQWQAPQQQTYQTYQQPQQPIQQQPAQQQWQPRYEEAPKPKKKSKVGKTILTIVIILAVLAGAVFGVTKLFPKVGDSVTNMAAKTFASEKDYYKYVETRGTDSVAKTVSAVYGNVRSLADYEGKKSTVGFTVKVSEDILELLSELGGMDLTWFESVGVNMSTATKGDTASANVGITLGSDKLVDLNCAVDMEEGMLYFQVPQLSDDWASVDLGDMFGIGADYGYGSIGGYGSAVNTVGMLSTILEATPDPETLERILTSYLDEIFSCVTKVKEGKDEIEAMGVSEKVTRMSVTIDEGVALRAAKAVLKKALKDSDLKAIIKDFEKALGLDGAYDEFIETVEYALEEVESNLENFEERKDDLDEDEVITMIVYTAADGTIRGRELQMGGNVLAYYIPHDGNDVGIELYFYDGWDEFRIGGKGTEKGDKFTGEFEIEVPDEDMTINIRVTDFDTKKFKSEGVLNGTVTVAVDPDEVGIYIPELPIRDEFAISITFSGDANEGKADFSIELDGKSMVTLSANSGISDGGKVTLPSKSVDVEDWVYDIDPYVLLEILDATDIPDEIMDELYDLMDYAFYY